MMQPELEHNPDLPQLSRIKAHLDLILLALEALAGIGSDAMLQAADDLGLQEVLGDRITLWRLRQASPLRKGKGGRKKLDVDEARALTLICSHLAMQKHAILREAIAAIEHCTRKHVPPHKDAMLGDYLDKFNNLYLERMSDEERLSGEALQRLALKLTVDLLFYSAAGGDRRLWVALLERSK